jgi:hypothetical protein
MLNDHFITKNFGAVLSFITTLLIIFVVFNRNILEANKVSFVNGGDGLKSTFCTLFHGQSAIPDKSNQGFQGLTHRFFRLCYGNTEYLAFIFFYPLQFIFVSDII